MTRPAVRTGLLLATATLLGLVATIFYLRILLYDYDARPLLISGGLRVVTAATRLDDALREELTATEQLGVFRHALARKSEQLLIGELHVDRCPVTQGSFEKFLQWQKLNRNAVIPAPEQPEDWTYNSSSHGHAISGRANASASGVTYYDAFSYCQAAGGRLPFSEEWIAIAAGKQARLYPWGDELDESQWSRLLRPHLNPLLNAAQACGDREQTATAEQVQDLGILVSEWAQSLHQANQPTLHGSGANQRPQALYCLNALYRQAEPDYRSPHIGFRCVYDELIRTTPWRERLETVRIEPGQYRVGIPDDARIPPLLARLPNNWLKSLAELLNQGQSGGDRTIYIMSREVTRRQYSRFLADPLVLLGLYGDENEPKAHSYRPAGWNEQQKQPELPVSGIDWWSARAFASWAGGRLPTAEEWAAAVSADGTSLYPWGNEYAQGLAVTGGNEWTSVQRSGTAAGDFTASGLVDMAGNLSEWTQSIRITDHSYGVVVKGGNYLLPGQQTARLDSSSVIPPIHRAPTIGLRLVFDREL